MKTIANAPTAAKIIFLVFLSSDLIPRIETSTAPETKTTLVRAMVLIRFMLKEFAMSTRRLLPSYNPFLASATDVVRRSVTLNTVRNARNETMPAS